MKHKITLFATAFSLLHAHGVIYGMEDNNKPDIYCEENVAIVLHFSDKMYNNRSHYDYSKTNPTEITYNLAKSNTSFDDHMKTIEEIFSQNSKKQIAYEISTFLIASHSKHVPRKTDIALPTFNYFNNAEKKITYFYNRFYNNSNNFLNYNQNINFYRIFYKPSYLNNEQKEQNDIELVTHTFETLIKIGHKATISFPQHLLILKMPHDMTTTIRFKPMSSAHIKMLDELIMDIQSGCHSIILMDV